MTTTDIVDLIDQLAARRGWTQRPDDEQAAKIKAKLTIALETLVRKGRKSS